MAEANFNICARPTPHPTQTISLEGSAAARARSCARLSTMATPIMSRPRSSRWRFARLAAMMKTCWRYCASTSRRWRWRQLEPRAKSPATTQQAKPVRTLQTAAQVHGRRLPERRMRRRGRWHCASVAQLGERDVADVVHQGLRLFSMRRARYHGLLELLRRDGVDVLPREPPRVADEGDEEPEGRVREPCEEEEGVHPAATDDHEARQDGQKECPHGLPQKGPPRHVVDHGEVERLSQYIP